MAVAGFLKYVGGLGLALAPQCRFERCVFLIGHMRSGSTALASILCSRPEISGYGESHVTYDSRASPGVLALNQIKRRRWKAGAPYLFDKILHNRLDANPPTEFFKARAIFVARAPDAAVSSIVDLSRAIGSHDYSPSSAANYYAERLARMRELWLAFPPAQRIYISYEALMATPEAQLSQLSVFLRLAPALCNAYSQTTLTQRHGAGDPINAHRHSRIVAGGIRHGFREQQTRPSPLEAREVGTAYAAFCQVARPPSASFG